MTAAQSVSLARYLRLNGGLEGPKVVPVGRGPAGVQRPLTADNIVALTVVTADGRARHCDARTNAEAEDGTLRVALIVFDAELSCRVRLERQTAPHTGTGLVTLESLGSLAG